MSKTRELLEAAARAGGIVVIRSRLDDPTCNDLLVADSARNPSQSCGPWNSQADDGDCARLEAVLGIDVEWQRIGVVATKRENDGHDVICREPYDYHGGDKRAARRMASTRVAAEIQQRKG